MYPKSSSKEATPLPRSSPSNSLWDLVGEDPTSGEMSCAVPAGIVRLRMPTRHLSQLIDWMHHHVASQMAAAAAWKNRNRKPSKRTQTYRRKAAITPKIRQARAKYMRAYRLNKTLLRRSMRGESMTQLERRIVEKHKSRLASRRLAARRKAGFRIFRSH